MVEGPTLPLKVWPGMPHGGGRGNDTSTCGMAGGCGGRQGAAPGGTEGGTMPELSAAGSTLPAALMLLPNVACALAYAALTVLILVQARRSRTGVLLAAAAGITAAWAAATVVTGAPLQGVANALDLLRAVAWYGFCLHLYRRATAAGRTLFTILGLLALLGVFATLATGEAAASGTVSLFSPALALRLALAICQLLLLENLYRG